ncbi:hypothetical protein BH24ACT3_BH24ACT3_03490 [soil metagenome]
MVVALLVGGCTDDGEDTAPDGARESDGSDPVTGSASITANPGNVLSASVRVKISGPARVTVTASAGEHRVEVPLTDEAEEHEIALAGLRADRDYDVEVAVVDDGGQTTLGEPSVFTTGPLPDDLPELERMSDPELMSGGLTLFDLLPFNPPGVKSAPRPGYLVIVDEEGEVVWYHTAEQNFNDARQLPNGSFLVSYVDAVALEIDLLGTTRREITSGVGLAPLAFDPGGQQPATAEVERADIDSVHHELGVLPADGPAGELLWELAPDGTLPLDGDQPDHLHAPEVQDDGPILIYDNGNDRPGLEAGELYSRAVLYDIDDTDPDPDNWNARQVWEHRLDDDEGRPTFAPFLGDADRLANGNALITHGAVTDAAATGALSARIAEVTQEGDAGSDVALELRVGVEEREWAVYRSDRIESLYPEG